MDNAMAQDFSWKKAAEQYAAIYAGLHPEIKPYKK
jgi:glycogen synthase